MAEDIAVLYKLVRNDMESLNPGKAIAQGGHASTDFAISILMPDTFGPVDDDTLALFHEWRNQSKGGTFGTELVKEATGREIATVISAAQNLGVFANTIVDDEYPLRDGDVTHLFPLMTCGFVFCRRSTGDALLRRFNLHP